MYHDKKAVLPVVIMASISVFVTAQTTSYEEFFSDFMNRKVEMLSQDVVKLGQLLNSWSTGEVSQPEVVASMGEIETRAAAYFTDILELSAPRGEFDKYQ